MMVLNAELESEQHSYICALLVQVGEGQVEGDCDGIVVHLGGYTTCAGFSDSGSWLFMCPMTSLSKHFDRSEVTEAGNCTFLWHGDRGGRL